MSNNWEKYAKPGYSVNLLTFGPKAFFMDLARSDKRFEPRRTEIIEPPTLERWTDYYEALRGLTALEAYGGTYWPECDCIDGPMKPTVDPPQPKHRWEWQETEQEWLDRCLALYDSETASRDTP